MAQTRRHHHDAEPDHLYDRLNVTLTRDDVMGESLYNPMLPGSGGSRSQRSGSRKRRGDRRIP
ncbi:hypothetical protein ACLB1M_15340 [Escherichia coli]